MRAFSPNDGQMHQRVRVGLSGLAIVLLLIGLATLMIRAVSKERPVSAIGAPQSDIVANLAMTNSIEGNATNSEPLAELGVAPAAPSDMRPAKPKAR